MYDNHSLLQNITLLFKILRNYLFLEIAICFADLYYLKTLQSEGSVNSGLQTYWEIKSHFLHYISYLLPLGIGIVFIVWFYREYWNLHYRLQEGIFKYKPEGAVWAFVIPIFNLFGPYLIMKEIAHGHEMYYNKKVPIKYIQGWWLGFIIWNIGGKIISLQKLVTADEFIDYTYRLLAIDAFGIVSLAFLILILHQFKTD